MRKVQMGQAAQKLGSTSAACADSRTDHAFLNAATSSDSAAVGVVTSGLMRAATDKRYQQDITAGRLLLVSVKAPEDDEHTEVDSRLSRTMIHSLAGRTILVRPGPPPSWQWADLMLPAVAAAAQTAAAEGKENEAETESETAEGDGNAEAG